MDLDEIDRLDGVTRITGGLDGLAVALDVLTWISRTNSWLLLVMSSVCRDVGVEEWPRGLDRVLDADGCVALVDAFLCSCWPSFS